jgi:hypothetical protein
VGSWAEDGVDPAEYSRTLMAHCCKALENSEGAAAALQVLQYAQVGAPAPAACKATSMGVPG